MPIEITRDRTSELHKAVKALAKAYVMVGIPGDSPPRADGAKIANSALGFINEFGRPEANIPARPHLMPAIEEASDEIRQLMLKGAVKALDLTGADHKQQIYDTMEAVGLFCVDEIKLKIQSRLEPKLSAKTLAARVKEGRDGDKPLLDKSEYIDSFTSIPHA